MKIKLTKRAIERIPAPHPSGKQQLVWDTEIKGFGLLVSGRTNSKTYVVQREVNRRTRRVSLGTVAEFEAAGESLEKVRTAAAKLVLQMKKGKDPRSHRSVEATATLNEILDLYLLARPNLSEHSKRKYRGDIERHLGDWGKNPLRDITPDMVEKRFRRISQRVAAAQTKNRNIPGNRVSAPGGATANGVMRGLRAVWNFAAEGRVPELPINPVTGLKRQWHSSPSRERLVSADDLGKFYAAVKGLPSRTMSDYLLLLLFTGLRRSEAGSLEWNDLDFAGRVIRLPANRTKARRSLDLPMSDFVHGLLVARRAIGYENEFVFPGGGKTRHLEEPKKALHTVGEMCGVTVSVHDLRRTFATNLRRCRVSPYEVSGLLNHAVGGDVTSGYDQMETADLSDAMQRVTDRLKELCGITDPEGVIPLTG